MDLGKRIRGRRERLGMTQVRLAELIGLPYSSLNRIENGQQNVTAVKVPRLAAALGWTVAQLYGEDGAGNGEFGEIIVSSEGDNLIIMIAPGALERFANDAQHRVYRARAVSGDALDYHTRILDEMQHDKLEKKVA